MAYNIQAELQKIPLFSSLESKDLEKLSTITKIVHYAKNSILLYENDFLNTIYYIIKGSVKLYKIDKYSNEIFLNQLYGGSFVALVESTDMKNKNKQIFYSVETVEESHVLLIDSQSFIQKYFNRGDVAKKLFEEVHKALLNYENIISRDLIYDSRAKVVEMICTELDEFNRLKKNEIAYHLHIQPETLSRIVKKLQSAQLIAIENRSVTILNKTALENLYK